jgi:pimeloyl-ACP methyl ester carboxylesterase
MARSRLREAVDTDAPGAFADGTFVQDAVLTAGHAGGMSEDTELGTNARSHAHEADRLVPLRDGTMHVVVDGDPGAPAIVLIHGTASSVDAWDPIVPALAVGHRVMRVDLLGHGRSPAATEGGYGIPDHARRVGEALDHLGVTRACVIAHSMGCLVATALAEARPEIVASVVLIDGGPDLDAAAPDGAGIRLLLTPGLGRLVWGVRTERMLRAAASSAVTRPVDLPRSMVLAAMNLSFDAFVGTDRAAREYLAERDLPSRLRPLGLPLLVIFGREDKRWNSSAASAYLTVPGARVELLPGIGHTPMLEDAAATSRLLTDFLAETAQRK